MLTFSHLTDSLCGWIRMPIKTGALQRDRSKNDTHEPNTQRLVLTEVLDGVVALLVVNFDGLSVGTADAIADGVTTHHDVLVLWRRPAHHDAVDQWADVERAGLVWYTRFWRGECRKNLSVTVTVTGQRSHFMLIFRFRLMLQALMFNKHMLPVPLISLHWKAHFALIGLVSQAWADTTLCIAVTSQPYRCMSMYWAVWYFYTSFK